MSDGLRTLTLPDGRVLAYAEYGDPDGVPLIHHHGSPGARIIISGNGEVAREMGVRVITADRPGYGDSDPNPGRELIDWPDDIAALADHLGLDTFCVSGKSGGAPHAAVCVARLPDRVTRAALVACPAPPGLPGVRDALSPGLRMLLSAGRRAPWLIRGATGGIAGAVHIAPRAYLRLLISRMSRPDREQLSDRDTRDELLRQYRVAFRQGGEGNAEDLIVMTRAWGVRPEELDGAKFILWHGRQDTIVPKEHGMILASRIPGCELRIESEAGHLLLESERYWRQILADLLEA